MKNHDLPTDDLRAEYHRQDLGTMVRGKYVRRVKARLAAKKPSTGKAVA